VINIFIKIRGVFIRLNFKDIGGNINEVDLSCINIKFGVNIIEFIINILIIVLYLNKYKLISILISK
ncbi:hypothetical protein OFC13_27255, partial [Escherichia coli]|nr:hypothetical protein [Escherichia coli]